MAASIKANPNPVLISVWSLGLNAVISWDTGGSAFGRVYRSIDGGAEEFFDGTSEPPATARNLRSGMKKQYIELGTTYDFRLKSTTMLFPVLATVRIKGEEKLGTTAGLAKILEERIPASQYIYGVRVTPGIDSVSIQFRTRQAAPCFIENTNDNTHAIVAL